MPPRPKRADGRRRRPRQERSRALVDAIVQATVELAAERGLEHVSTDHIAARAGVSVGSVYQYFASKDVAVREAIERRARAGHDAMVTQLATIATLPLEEAIAAAVRFLVGWFAADAPAYTELFRHVGRVTEHAAVREELDRVIFAATALLSMHRARLGGRDPALVAYVMTVACTRVVEDALQSRAALVADGSLERELVALCLAFVTNAR
ncbi:MAG: TetR/AcrR family transcriptional regulator [Myxococcales bacterium]|nr:TetR/AcrR family transcriptional regulator [Myxococcales bacterium]MBP6842792.1 TetR/AcrR family transcriptional regulator [Kofleriaceae bacterium]